MPLALPMITLNGGIPSTTRSVPAACKRATIVRPVESRTWTQASCGNLNFSTRLVTILGAGDSAGAATAASDTCTLGVAAASDAAPVEGASLDTGFSCSIGTGVAGSVTGVLSATVAGAVPSTP